MTSNLLEIQNLQAWYGDSHVLHGVNLHIQNGKVLALLGRNGSGRTTIMRSIMGLVSSRSGSIKLQGKEMIGLSTHRIARLGVGYCPEERAIFSSLSTEENLLLPPKLGEKVFGLDKLYKMFPNIKERATSPGTRLSGGEQQMLAIARILHAGTGLLLLDEISEGLAPVIVHKLADMIVELKEQGYTILMAEQNFNFIAPLADDFALVENGLILEQFGKDKLQQKQDGLNKLLGV